MMCRIDPAVEEAALEKRGARPMDFTSRPMKGYVYVSEEGMRTKKELEYWVNLCLDFNSKARSSKKSAKKQSKKSAKKVSKKIILKKHVSKKSRRH
jgi:hypothetical protein